MSFIEIPITQKMREIAEYKANELGTLRNSIERGDGNLAGFLGELALYTLIGGEVVNTYDYDIIYNDKLKIDVKTKRTKFPPKMYYDASVAAANIKQKCHAYAFGRIMNDYSKYWLCGFYNKNSFYKHAVFCKRGDIDPNSGRVKFRYKADCYSLPYGQLIIPASILSTAKNRGLNIL